MDWADGMPLPAGVLQIAWTAGLLTLSRIVAKRYRPVLGLILPASADSGQHDAGRTRLDKTGVSGEFRRRLVCEGQFGLVRS
jgi:hypothetical protein